MSNLRRFFWFTTTALPLLFFVSLSVGAQSAAKKIPLTPMVSDVLELHTTTKNALQQKLTQMALQNGMAARNGDFVLTSSISVVENETTASVPPMHAVKLDVMFYVVNLIDNLVMAESTVTVKGVDSNENKAILRAVNQINPRSEQSKAFIEEARNNIIDYYSSRVETLEKKAQSLADKGQYEEALAVLDQIPDCVPAYEEVIDFNNRIFTSWVDLEADALIADAKKSMALGRYDDAYNSLLSVNPLSTKMPEVNELSRKIDSRIAAAAKAAAESKAKEREAAVAIAQAESEAIVKEQEAEIARANAEEARANAEEAQANADASAAQAAMSQSELQKLNLLKKKMNKLSDDAQKAIIDNSFRSQTQQSYVVQAVNSVPPSQTMQEKTASLKKFLLGKMYKA